MRRQRWLIAGIAALALAAGWGAAAWLRQPGPPPPTAADTLLTAQMPDLKNQLQTLAQYRGKVLVVNFWATWCPPCREEIPVFVEAQDQFGPQGLQFVGIALDDPAQVAGFARKFGVNYPILIGGLKETETLRELGNSGGGLP